MRVQGHGSTSSPAPPRPLYEKTKS
jgi:hypothetical protein